MLKTNLAGSLTPKPAYYITAKKMSIAAAGDPSPSSFQRERERCEKVTGEIPPCSLTMGMKAAGVAQLLTFPSAMVINLICTWTQRCQTAGVPNFM
jgi:hypothetical protein